MNIGTSKRRVFVLGATGTIGRATVRALVQRGHDVVCFVRPRPTDGAGGKNSGNYPDFFKGIELRHGDVTDAASLSRDGFRGETFDAVVSCLGSRTGAPKDAWSIDHAAHVSALSAAKTAGISHFILLSAICVQKPVLAFQKAKLAFEAELMASGVPYSIIRPTAFFKSLSGQVERVRNGKSFLVFGDGTLTACKPISDRDLGDFIADCLHDESRLNRILPIGGPGDAITPKQQGERLFDLLGREPRFRRVPLGMLDLIIGVLAIAGKVSSTAADKAELARIGRYYATESMLVWDEATGRYDADATPSTGSDTLFDFYAALVDGEATVDRGDHAVF